jgi:hypothetical protein
LLVGPAERNIGHGLPSSEGEIKMSANPRALGFMPLLSVMLLALSITCSAATTDLLYVQEGHNVITYKVTSTAVTQLGTLHVSASTAFPIQIFHAPKAPFLYVLGFTSTTQEYFWVYATSSTGVPAHSPIQTLSVKPALTQFFIHPNGKFAYALFLWKTPNPNVGPASDIVLFTVSSTSGKLANTRDAVANFAPFFLGQTTINGLSHSGNKLYSDTNVGYEDVQGDAFDYYSVNGSTGLLGSGVPFWSFFPESQASGYSAFSDQLIALWNSGEDSLAPGIYVYPNTVNPSTPLVFCDATMLAVCEDTADYLAPMRFDPAGKFLFLNDDSIHSVIITAVDPTHGKLHQMARSIPGNPTNLSFSLDEKFVYAVEGKDVLIDGFNSSSGLLTTERSVSLPLTVNGIVAASHP